MNSLQDYSVVNLLPESLKKDPFIVALGEAVEKELKEAYREAESLSNFYDVDKLPVPLLDYLAYQKHVDFYEPDLPIEQKRKLVKNTTSWHRKKGTPWAVEQVTSIVFPNAEVVEWFEYGGSPYYFLVKLDLEEDFSLSTDKPRLKRLIDTTKNKRSWLEKIVFKADVIILFQKIIQHEINSRVRLHVKVNPWALAGIGNGAGVEKTLLDGKYKLNGDTFLNSFIKTEGPDYLTDIRLTMKVIHDFGVHEVSIVPILDGEYILDGEIRLQHDLQTVRLPVKQEASLRYKQREVINLAPAQKVPMLSTVRTMSGVNTLNGNQVLDGSIALNQTLFEHSGLFRVKKSGVTVEEVAI